MAVGFAVDKAIIDSQAGNIVYELRTALDKIVKFKAHLDALPDQDLVDLGYTSGEVAILKSAYGDLKKFSDIYTGADTQTSAYDFSTFAKLLLGVL